MNKLTGGYINEIEEKCEQMVMEQQEILENQSKDFDKRLKTKTAALKSEHKTEIENLQRMQKELKDFLLV